jgi:hypothetical protein
MLLAMTQEIYMCHYLLVMHLLHQVETVSTYQQNRNLTRE